MSASESWDALAVLRPAVIRPDIPAELQAPAPNLAAPTPEQARAADAVFSREENAEAGALLALWSAGMLANELVADAVAAHLSDDDEGEEEGKAKKRKPELPRPEPPS